MQTKRWCLKVHRSEGEKTRRRLLEEGLLDRLCRIRSDGDYLLIPISGHTEGAVCEIFTCVPEKEELPRFEQVGGIAIMQEDDPAGAAAILASKKTYHTVLYAESAVHGPYRTKRYKVLAGADTTATEYTEYGHRFCIDLSLAYFSARLSSERQRIRNQMHIGERVIDMFAGVGPFAITLADKASVVYACDINPEAVILMVTNIARNQKKNIVPLLADARNLPGIIRHPADRIIMNLPLHSIPFVQAAFQMARPGGMIHLYALVSQEDEYLETLRRFPVEQIEHRYVRSYSPDRFHVVYDIIVAATNPS
ncbi:MAG TPA: class I SAM-dependent methyltransferase family protein [Methanospirillum sp.]|uniref:class I SAM-dependent methyltransferase n=1 Tax=Methanospirillum sp. TaxID=45200 RepID=UPI002B5F1D8D|nr:class I SAM-dependent methyltransferase family protein [Methanospirillum sp.]HOJ97816.1 class I SAM-dependent methyltransferase family protein [Methanospirillum sp.]